jgi:predicted amidohydrolase
MAQTVRVSVVQSRTNPTVAGLRANPFHKDFSRVDLFASIERHIAWFERWFDRAAADRCRLTVITEDFTRLGLVATYLDDRSLFQEAVAVQTPLIAERLGAAARKHGMYIVASYYTLDGEAIYNVADLFDPRGEIAGRYHKVHLPLYEQWQVRAGNAFPAFETELGWVSMLVCYDQMWPESVTCCALNGAQIICQPSAASLSDYHMRARAMDSQTHMLSATYMRSMITSPRAEILADAGEQEHAVVWADVDLEAATRADAFFWEYLYSGIQNHKERHLKFRRPDAYGPITDIHPPLVDQYPEGGRADTPDAIAEVYRIHKTMQQKIARGEETPYHWRW